LPFLVEANIWAAVSFLIAGSETGFTPVAFVIPALGVPVTP
jgi:hypothetical protein